MATTVSEGITKHVRHHLAAALAALLVLAGCGSCGQSASQPSPPGQRTQTPRTGPVASSTALPPPAPSTEQGLVHEVRSEYSHIRIYDRGTTRYLMFVRDSGHEVVESALDLRRPDLLEISYTQTMFVSHLFRPEQERVLLIGLGGGSMVRFLRRFFPEVAITAVDIDPAIVEIAQSYFGVAPGPNLEILAEDGFEFLARPGPRYDVIYMDAFLKPGMDTDTEGAPLRMQTVTFLRSLQERLVPGGLLVININVQDDTPEDIATLRETYPQVYLFEGGGNLIAVGSTDARRISDAALRRTGRRLDARAQHGFSFAEMVDYRTDE